MSRADFQAQDYSDIAFLQKSLIETSEEISRMTDEVAKARQIKEYDSERRKTALSCEVAKLLGDKSAAAAEHMARASDAYHKSMARLAQDLFVAEKTILAFDTAKIRWESLRSTLSSARFIAESI